jgi:predicted nucleic acid-binding protein
MENLMKQPLDAKAVREWLEGQEEAEKVIRRERVKFLLSLTPEKSLELYLSLSRIGYKARREPSFVLLKMRQCLETWTRSKEVEFYPLGKLRLISAEDLIVYKCVAGRPRDVEDVEKILVKQRLQVDLEHIRSLLRSFREVVEKHDPLELFEGALRRAQNLLKEGEGQ